MNKFISYIKQNIKALGALNFVIYVLNRAMQRIWSGLKIKSYVVVKQPTSGNSLLVKYRKKGEGIEIKEIGRDDPGIQFFPCALAEINRRFDNAAHCFTASRNGDFVGYIWLLFGSYLEEEDRCLMVPQPTDSTAWDLDVYVDPNERLSLVFLKLWDAANEFLKKNGKEWTVSRISVFNYNSISAHKRLGAIVVARLNFLSVGALQLYFGTLFPYLHVAIKRNQYPTIYVGTCDTE